jgi:peptide chain release factor 2
MNDLSKKDIQDIQKDIEQTIKSLNLDDKKSRLIILENDSLQKDFWNDNKTAQSTMREIEHIRKEINTAQKLREDINSLAELFNMVEKETDQNQLIEEYQKLRERLNKFSIRKFLSGKYDNCDAIFSLHSGQGGTEANDWTEMLLRMYEMYFDKQGWKHKITHIVKGTETGISTVSLHVQGEYVFGMLKKEHGTHRLVRLSPFNAQNLRQTSFAGVEVLPKLEKMENDIEIPDTDIEFKAVRSGGPGGQKVNKTSSAVQILHKPTGITVHSSEERSQVQNRENALNILKAKLWRIQQDERLEEISEIKGEHRMASWGNQIRNYVLHPYKLVKDLRTNVESQNPEDILDGNLDEFIEAEIRLE